MRDVLLVVDVLDDFRHEDGERLLASFRDRVGAMGAVLGAMRASGVPIVYANDHRGSWDGDRARLVADAVEHGLGGEVVAAVAPAPDDRLIVKPRYSAFDLTPLELILAELDAERVVLIGATTEMCVAQTAIDARERGFKATVVVDACACIDGGLEQTALEYLERVAGVRLAQSTAFSQA